MKIAIVAGEASGDLLGASLIRALRSRHPGVEFYGIAGPKMVAEGARTLFPMEKLSVRGYVEVLRHLREILAIRSSLKRRILADRPDLFIGVDAPDFNLGLAASLKARGIRTIHYVAPAVWAWRADRIRKIRRAVDRLLVVFPFEEEVFRKGGVPATYVGHPLADVLPLVPEREDARAQLRLPPSATAVAMLPGSRMSELEHHADLYLATARAMLEKRPGLRFFVPLATRETRELFEARVYESQAQELPITVLFGHARLALQAADVALVASGTATLEAALARCPMVITYRVPALTYRLMWRKAVLPYVGLPNILAGEFIVPELLQNDATPANLAQALGNWLDSRTARERLMERFERLHAALAVGHEERIAQALENELAPSRHHASPPTAGDPVAAVRR